MCVILSKAHEILKLCFQFVLAKVEMWKAYYQANVTVNLI